MVNSKDHFYYKTNFYQLVCLRWSQIYKQSLKASPVNVISEINDSVHDIYKLLKFMLLEIGVQWSFQWTRILLFNASQINATTRNHHQSSFVD